MMKKVWLLTIFAALSLGGMLGGALDRSSANLLQGGLSGGGSCPGTGWVLCAHTTVTGTSPITTPAIDTTGADFLVVTTAQDPVTGQPGSLVDSKGNSYTFTESSALTTRTQILFNQGGTVGSGHTFTFTTAGSVPTIAVEAWKGSVASPLDQHNYGPNSSADMAAAASGSGFPFTPVQNGELIIVGGQATPPSTCTFSVAGPTMTISDQGGSFSTGFSGMAAYLVQTTAATINPTITCVGGTPYGVIASFKHP